MAIQKPYADASLKFTYPEAYLKLGFGTIDGALIGYFFDVYANRGAREKLGRPVARSTTVPIYAEKRKIATIAGRTYEQLVEILKGRVIAGNAGTGPVLSEEDYKRELSLLEIQWGVIEIPAYSDILLATRSVPDPKTAMLAAGYTVMKKIPDIAGAIDILEPNQTIIQVAN